jgi:hypothetical protein
MLWPKLAKSRKCTYTNSIDSFLGAPLWLVFNNTHLWSGYLKF